MRCAAFLAANCVFGYGDASKREGTANTMNRTLLMGSPGTQWRERLEALTNGRPLLVADPMDPNHGTPGRVALYQGSRCVSWRLVGALDVARNPLALLQGLAQLLPEAGDHAVVQLFAPRPTPLHRQLAVACAQLIAPTEVLVPPDFALPLEGWPVGPQTIEAEPAFPAMVRNAQRRARWLELLEQCHDHTVAWRDVNVQGARMGTGLPADPSVRQALGDSVVMAEVAGKTLVTLASGPVSEDAVARALDLAHAERWIALDPMQFSGRLCAFARSDGEPFGLGVVEEMDVKSGTLSIRCTAIPPAPVRILTLGTLRLDAQGREVSDEAAWII